MRTSWHTQLVKFLGPVGLGGGTISEWMSTLRRNRFRVDLKYWPRAAAITANCLLNSLVLPWERLCYDRRVARTEITPPVFVLGIWRSGTTYLHNLLTQDDRFATPTTYQCSYPKTFLCSESFCHWILHVLSPPVRPMDNVRYGSLEPQEDEFAMAASGLSYMNGLFSFPRHASKYRGFLTIKDASPRDRVAWTKAFEWFLKKLSYRLKKPLVLKSPPHTARIETLLELFPDAKFVHIRRHPYDVFQSTKHAWPKIRAWWSLQDGDFDVDQVIGDYVHVYDAFFTQRQSIPKGNFFEVAFEDIEQDPVGQVASIYSALNLPDFEYARPAIDKYVESVSGYQRNQLPIPAMAIRQRLSHELGRCFDEWGYESDLSSVPQTSPPLLSSFTANSATSGECA